MGGIMTFIIAEAGINHDGKWERGLDLIDAAKEAGADAVKFQMFNSQELWGDDRIEHLEFSQDQMIGMKAHCVEVGLEFMCTPFSVEAVKFLTPLVKRHKIASGCRNLSILNAVAATKLPVIMSCGMAETDEIEKAAAFFEDDTTLMQCTSSYPCHPNDVNLLAFESLVNWNNYDLGFSDHTQGITASIAAVAMGATVIEKHLTLDKTADGPDHSSSIEPQEFKAMVEGIREVEIMLGDGEKKVLECEKELRRQWYE